MRARMLVAAVSFLAVAPPAQAAVPQQAVTTIAGFTPGQITIHQGDTLTLNNVDVRRHDLVADDPGTYGGHLFGSGTAEAGQRQEVFGVASLRPYTYTFHCSFHTDMLGSLTVEPPLAS